MLYVDSVGNNYVPVFDLNGRRVIKVTKNGDGFGQVVDVESGEYFNIYGFDTLPRLSCVACVSVKIEFITKQD